MKLLKNIIFLILLLLLQLSFANNFASVFTINKLGVDRIEFSEKYNSVFSKPNFKGNYVFEASFLEATSCRSVFLCDCYVDLVESWVKMNNLNAGVDLRKNTEALDALLKKKNGEEIPLPKTYLDADYISNHLSKFDEGVSFLVPEQAYKTFIKNSKNIGYPDGQFVSTSKSIDDILNKANGDISIIEYELGIQSGAWQAQGKKVYRIDVIKIDNQLDLRMPRGNEMGADEDLWLPGGFTSNNRPEALVNQIPNTREYVKKYRVIGK